MNNSTLEDEVVSINAIYGDGSLMPDGDGYHVLRVPETSVALRLAFPAGYPDAPPSILGPQSSGAEVRKGKANEVVKTARSVLGDAFEPGEPCIFQLVQILLERMSEDTELHAVEANVKIEGEDEGEGVQGAGQAPAIHAKINDSVTPDWTVSEVTTEKKSVFVARCASVESVQQAKEFVEHLVSTDKKASKATHNITAWRIRHAAGSGVTFQDCDDDGEMAAGGRLLHLLQVMDSWNIVVVVSRWYGGVQLGPDRFKIINNVARDCVLQFENRARK